MAAPPFDRDTYAMASPPLDGDMYGEVIPPVVAGLLAHLESVGLQVEGLFLGDPQVRAINDVINAMRNGGGHADVHAVTHGDPQLAAATLAAYTRQLPEALLPSPFAEQMFAELDVGDYASKIAAIRDIASALPGATNAFLHRLFYFLNKLGGRDAVAGNALEDLATFWSTMLLPNGRPRTRARRVAEFRLVGLLLQQCACVFQGALDTLDLPELALPPHLVAEEAEEAERARQWIRIKASLLRDSWGQFKIIVMEVRLAHTPPPPAPRRRG